MSETILQIFLNNQFIKTADTGNIESLGKAVTAVKGLLAKKKQLVIPYTLVALDPQISGTDPVVSEVEATIIKNWPTFKNSTSTKDKPTTYVRVVILQALAELSKDEHIAAVIWLTGRNVIAAYKTHKEREPMAALLVKMGTQFENVSREDWSLGEPVFKKIDELDITIPAGTSSRVTQEELTAILKSASVYTGWTTQAGGGENPAPQHQGNWDWAKFFSEKAAEGFSASLNKALTNSDKTVSAMAAIIQKDINSYFAQFQEFFTDAAATLVRGANAANKRGDLLWWKQALYSNSLNTSYRSLAPIGTAIAMVIDLASLVSLMYPESVNYLLKEALRDVHGDQTENKDTLSGWLTKAKACGANITTLLTPLENPSTGRKSLGAAFANSLTASTPVAIAADTGIEDSQELSLSEFAVWLFNDLQALKLASHK